MREAVFVVLSYCVWSFVTAVLGTVQELVKVSSNDLVMLTGERVGKRMRFSSQHRIAKARGRPNSLFKIQIPGAPPRNSERESGVLGLQESAFPVSSQDD